MTEEWSAFTDEQLSKILDGAALEGCLRDDVKKEDLYMVSDESGPTTVRRTYFVSNPNSSPMYAFHTEFVVVTFDFVNKRLQADNYEMTGGIARTEKYLERFLEGIDD